MLKRPALPAFHMNSVSRRMTRDWNRRAQSDAPYYVALGQRGQSWEEFLSGGTDLVLGLEKELSRLSNPSRESRRALEIGCGPGRLLLPLSRHFSEIHGIDVSAAMVRLAERNLSGVAHAHVHASGGIDLALFAGEYFDFVYSYAVFQHIPSRDVVLNYLRETRRVLKPGGIARLHFNGLAAGSAKYDTWSGVRFAPGEIGEFARVHDLQLLALEGIGTQYMWATFSKPRAALLNPGTTNTSIRRVTNAGSSESVVPVRGRHAAFALWVERLPVHADLNTLRIHVAGREARITCIGAAHIDGLQQVTAILPEGLGTGFQPFSLTCAGTPVECTGHLRLIPPGPEVPRVVSVTDGVCAGAGRVIASRTVRVSLEETHHPENLRADIDGRPLRRINSVCSVPDIPRFEVDFKLPAGISAGTRTLECRLDHRYLGATEIQVTVDPFWWWRRLRRTELYQALR
jgi:ubiquinone/menaquinone biosynthesis C-methylase UbiE